MITPEIFWSAPFTKSGKSALVIRGPWVYAMSGIGALYKADPKLLKDVTPKPLEVADGEVFAYVVDIISWSSNASDLVVEAPDLIQYMEGAFFVKVIYNNKKYLYCPYMWVDNDLPFLRGLLAGWPKKLAKIAITRLHPLLEHLDKPRKGIKLGGYLTRAGSMLYRIKVELLTDSPLNKIPLLTEYSFLLPRYFAGIAPGLGAINELIEFDGETNAMAWEGIGKLEILGSVNDELDSFKPLSDVKGYYFIQSLRVKGLKNVGKLDGF
jgi:hypothetical protein